MLDTLETVLSMRADPRRVRMMRVTMTIGLGLAAFFAVLLVVQRAPWPLLGVPALIALLALRGFAWARHVRDRLLVELGPEEIVYRGSNGRVRTVAYRDVARIEITGAPTMRAADAFAGVAGGAIGRRVVSALSVPGEAAPAVVPVAVKVWTQAGGRPVTIPADNLCPEESLGIASTLRARGVPAEAIETKLGRKATIR